jgi:hypothetical protein
MDLQKTQLLLQMLGQVFETCTSKIRSRNANLSKRSLVPRIPHVTLYEFFTSNAITCFLWTSWSPLSAVAEV